MLNLYRRVENYIHLETGKPISHHLIIEKSKNRETLLSHPNLFLSYSCNNSIQTSNRYSSVITKFYTFLSTLDKFKGKDLSEYHVLASNIDIKRWQIHRQIERVKSQSVKPTSKSIYEDAQALLVFFNWLNESGYPTCVQVKKKQWKANFRNDSLLNYISKKAKVSIDAKNVTVLDKESRQKKNKTLISQNEINWFRESFNDPVYDAIFMLCLGTAMRPIDLCRFPYIGTGSNSHIMPYSDMDQSTKTIEYHVSNSKGGKSRDIVINIKDLERLENNYINKHFYERKEKYTKRYGKECPPHILFLNKFGKPVTPTMVSSRGSDAKNLAIKNHSEFREGTTFYDARDWWPTMFMIRTFKEKLLTEETNVLYLAVAEVVMQQMGHEDIATTYKHYIDMAKLIVIAHKGQVNELVKESFDAVSCVEKYDSVLHEVF